MRFGEAAQEILRTAAEQDADLLILGLRGSPKLAGQLPSATAYELVRRRRPALTLKILTKTPKFGFLTSSTTQKLSFRPEVHRFWPSRSGGTVFHRTLFVRSIPLGHQIQNQFSEGLRSEDDPHFLHFAQKSS